MNASTAISRRIVVMAGYAPSLVNFRGPLLRALRQQGHEVIALAPGDAPEIQSQLSAWGIPYHPVSLERTGMNVYRDARDVWTLTRLLRRLNPDVFLGYTVKPATYGLIAARAAGIPQRFALITGLGYSFQGESWKRRVISGLVSALYRVALAGANRTIFQNPDDRALFTSRGLVPLEKTAVVNGSGVDLAHYAPAPLPDSPIFLLIARLLREKGILEYVQAARALRPAYPQARFLLAGPFDPNPAAIHPQELQDWQDQGLIEYLGELGDVRPALQACSVYVLPSYREGTPRTVLEAMATGRPVITTDAPGCRETVVHEVNGLLVPVQDAASLQRAMERLIQDIVLRKQMADAGLRRVHERYEVNSVNTQMLRAMELT